MASPRPVAKWTGLALCVGIILLNIDGLCLLWGVAGPAPAGLDTVDPMDLGYMLGIRGLNWYGSAGPAYVGLDPSYTVTSVPYEGGFIRARLKRLDDSDEFPHTGVQSLIDATTSTHGGTR